MNTELTFKDFRTYQKILDSLDLSSLDWNKINEDGKGERVKKALMSNVPAKFASLVEERIDEYLPEKKVLSEKAEKIKDKAEKISKEYIADRFATGDEPFLDNVSSEDGDVACNMNLKTGTYVPDDYKDDLTYKGEPKKVVSISEKISSLISEFEESIGVNSHKCPNAYADGDDMLNYIVENLDGGAYMAEPYYEGFTEDAFDNIEIFEKNVKRFNALEKRTESILNKCETLDEALPQIREAYNKGLLGSSLSFKQIENFFRGMYDDN